VKVALSKLLFSKRICKFNNGYWNLEVIYHSESNKIQVALSFTIPLHKVFERSIWLPESSYLAKVGNLMDEKI